MGSYLVLGITNFMTSIPEDQLKTLKNPVIVEAYDVSKPISSNPLDFASSANQIIGQLKESGYDVFPFENRELFELESKSLWSSQWGDYAKFALELEKNFVSFATQKAPHGGSIVVGFAHVPGTCFFLEESGHQHEPRYLEEKFWVLPVKKMWEFQKTELGIRENFYPQNPLTPVTTSPSNLFREYNLVQF